MKKLFISCLALTASLASMAAAPTVTSEKLVRGAVAVKTTDGVFVSWRSFVNDDPSMTFDLYRDGVKVNAEPISRVTNYVDAAGTAGATYEVKCLVGGNVVDSSTAAAWDKPYMTVHLDRPAGGTSKAGGADEMRNYTYTPDDVSVGDVDGDGVMELFVKWFPTNQADNSFYRHTGNTIIDCYRLDGTKLWRIDLGENIRSGNHYTQFMVYDFNGDGKAEMICKTAPGSTDSKGKVIKLGNDEVKSYANSQGHIISGPEYLTVFDGLTGAEIHTINYNPPRTVHSFDKSTNGWGDSYGGRSERYLAGVAYLDGKNPSAIFCRGYYTYSYVWAVDFDGTQLKERWLYSSPRNKGLYGEGAHSLTVGDVDGDGCDEIVMGSACVNNDGTLLYRTGFGHGDALHLTDMLPERAGLEVYMVHEEKGSAYKWDVEMRDAKTGEVLYGQPQSGQDIGRGVAANITSLTPGYEYWSSRESAVYNAGEQVGTKRPSTNFRVYWDGDLLDELLDGTVVSKPNNAVTSIATLVNFTSYGKVASCNSTKKTPNLQADLMGDWREEIILHDSETESDLYIYTTTIPTEYKVPCLMQDRQYRLAVAWQNCAYNQPPHLGYNLEATFDTKAMISVTSGSLNQVVDLNTAMTPIEFDLLRCTGVTAEGLPAGVSLKFDAATLRGVVSGTPTAEGEFKFTLTTTGSPTDEDKTVNGTILVRRSTKLEPMAQISFETLDEATSTTPNAVYGAMTLRSKGELVEGKAGNAIKLTTGYLKQEPYEALDFGGDDFTVDMWINSTASEGYIFHKGSISNDKGGTNNGNWIGLEYKGGNLKFAIDDDVQKTEAAASVECMDGKWHHIAMVRDTYTHKLMLYYDGALVSETDDATGALDVQAQNLVIGNVNLNFDNNFVGMIDEVNIFKGAMTAARIKERYETTGKNLAYYPLDELGESTPNKTFGEATPVGEGLQIVSGVKGGAMLFNDAAYLEQPAYEAMQLGDSDFSIEMWMYSTDTNGYLFFKGSHADKNDGLTSGHWVGIERKKDEAKGTDYLDFVVDDNVTKTDCKLNDAAGVFDGKWHHVVAVRDRAEKMLRLYIDGVEAVAVNDNTGAISDLNEPIRIGCSDETDRPFAGVMDELTVHPKALTADEIAARYNALKDIAAGVDDIVAAGSENARYTVVSATTGMILRTAIGANAADVMENLATGVYIIVVEDGIETKNYKLIKR